ncbi:MAG: tetratricopeptide repeat protein, partial [Halieaceae bacterium]|nr:tetratricopeptide repeat protein [Halieaceae bacterium]
MPVEFKQMIVLLCLFALPLTATAHLPQLYGAKFLRAPLDTPSQAPDCGSGVDPSDEDANRQRRQIEEIESRQGSYGGELAEPLTDLGRHYRNRGDYVEAERLYTRALHLVRINEGLNSELQLVLLKDLAATYRLKGDLNRADEIEGQVFRLQGGGRPPHGKREIEASLHYMAWQRQAHSLGLEGYNLQRLLEAYLLNERLLASLAQNERTGEDDYTQLIFSQLSNLYQILGTDFQESATHSVASSTELHPSQSASPLYVRQRIARIQIKGVRKGHDLLDELLSMVGPEEKLHRASLLLEMGDWYQWNGEPHKAVRDYAELERILASQDDPGLVEKWLGAPTELPSRGPQRQIGTDAAVMEPGAVTTVFDVSARGQVEQIEVIALSRESADREARIKRFLAETHFRP